MKDRARSALEADVDALSRMSGVFVNAKKYGLAKIAAIGGVLLGVIAWAATNPLVFTAIVTDGTLSIATTQPLPKGYFSSRNSFDRAKTDLRITYTVGATACSAEASRSLSSLSVGEFTPVLNANDSNVIGYHFNTTVDVASFAEHYTIHIHCDGTQHIHGCNVARPVTVTIQAFDNKTGLPLTYVDDAGVTQLVIVTLDAGSIAPVLDATIVDTCDVDCGVGTCVSACEDACPRGRNGRADPACANGCSCQCRLQKFQETGGACHPNAPEQCAP